VRKGTGVEVGGEPEGFNVSRVLCETPLRVAVIAAVEITETVDVVTMKAALVYPGGTVTTSGTWTAALSLETTMTASPAGAVPVSVTLPLEFAPPVTVAGFSVSTLGARGVPGGATVRRTLCDTPL
jgi:hypothetical protein